MWKVRKASDFESGLEGWQAAADRASASVLLGVDFVSALLRAYGSGRELLAIYEGDDGPEAATLLYPRKSGVWNTFNPSEVCVGLWIQPRGADTLALLGKLLGKLPGLPLVTTITQQDPKFSERPVDRGRVRTLDYIRTAAVALEGDFERYWAARGKNLRHNLKRARSEMTKRGLQPRLEIITDPGGVASALADYVNLEASGWKGREATAVQRENAQGRFYRELLEKACEKKIGRIYRYMVNEQTAAMDLCIEDADSLVILKTAYDESHAKLSPASLMREEQCRQLFAEGRMRWVEFYGPAMEWHMRWTEETRTMYHINYYRSSLLNTVHGLVRRRFARRQLSVPADQPAVAPGS